MAIQPPPASEDGLREMPADSLLDAVPAPTERLSVRERSKAAAAADSANGRMVAVFDAYHATREDDGPYITGAVAAISAPAELRQIDEEDEDERAIEATRAPLLQPPPSGVDDRNV
jgi:hypothetical protein